MDPIQPHERYIAIGAENFSAAIGLNESKYLTPKVGIFLYGPDSRSLREQVEGMSLMSANPEMSIYPLIQIMEVMQETFSRHAKHSPKYKTVVTQFNYAIETVRAIRKTLEENK